MPTLGGDEWDRPGGPLYDPKGLSALRESIRNNLSDSVQYHELDAHINDVKFVESVLEIFDTWCVKGIVSAK